MSRKMTTNTLRTYYAPDFFRLYLHHLLDIVGLKIIIFLYHAEVIEDILKKEKSSASLSNVISADCLRFLGIKRQWYIDIMNQYRSNFFFFEIWRNDHLPIKPVENPTETW